MAKPSRYLKPLVLTFIEAVLWSLGIFLGTWIIDQLRLIQIDLYQSVIIALIGLIVVELIMFGRQYFRLRRALDQSNLKIESMKASGVWKFLPAESAQKVLTKDDPEFVLKRHWPDDFEVKVEFDSDVPIDAHIAVRSSDIVRMDVAYGHRMNSWEEHKEAVLRYSLPNTKSWSKDFPTYAGHWYLFASLPKQTQTATVRIRVSELRRITSQAK